MVYLQLRRSSMKQVGRASAGIVLFLVVVIHLEITSYVFTSYGWPRLSPIPGLAGNPKVTSANTPLKILLVADPQIIGEQDELPFVGILSRWDADSYLSRTYRLAKFHVQPNVVIFLGDLFDEGSKATSEEASRYLSRLNSIFRLRRYDGIRYVYLLGDNDVGGDGEPVYLDKVKLDKVKWFNESVTAGQIGKPIRLDFDSYLRLRLMLMHLFLPNVFEDPLASFKADYPELRMALTHISCLKNYQICSNRLETLSPGLILSGDIHKSTYYQLRRSRKIGKTDWPRPRVNVYKKFLVPGERNFTFESTMFDGSVKFREETLRLQLRLTNDTPNIQVTHEITVPTCSYRMGVPNMGYGFLEIYKNGTSDYTVLWLPSRYHQLYVYVGVGFYILFKFIFTAWVFRRVAYFLWRKYCEIRSRFKFLVGYMIYCPQSISIKFDELLQQI